MSYYFNTIIKGKTFEESVELTTAELDRQGFGIITQIDVKNTFKQKLDVEFRPYTILGACNPGFAHKVINEEAKIGVFLPCNVVVEQLDNGDVEVSAVDPIASLMASENDTVKELALEIQQKLKSVISNL
ncbi:DUF302 domain-containing protein [bacterium]|nr:DUF302 domain-containing protein [bacterium]